MSSLRFHRDALKIFRFVNKRPTHPIIPSGLRVFLVQNFSSELTWWLPCKPLLVYMKSSNFPTKPRISAFVARFTSYAQIMCTNWLVALQRFNIVTNFRVFGSLLFKKKFSLLARVFGVYETS
jgi:hypothetical protein